MSYSASTCRLSTCYKENSINAMRVFETEDGVENDKANEPEGLTRILGHNTPLILVPSEDL